MDWLNVSPEVRARLLSESGKEWGVWVERGTPGRFRKVVLGVSKKEAQERRDWILREGLGPVAMYLRGQLYMMAQRGRS